MYFITCFSNFESEYLDNYRTFGYFGNYATCRKALNENWTDMCEARYYTYAVIEEISEGKVLRNLKRVLLYNILVNKNKSK